MMYKARSGIIEYKLTGNSTGSETWYFDDHGKREAHYKNATTKVMGMTTEEKTLSLRIDSVLYEIDLNEKTGTRTVIPFDPSELTDEEIREWEALGKQMMEDMGFEKVGKEKILGYDCEIWEGMGTKMWIWDGLSLKSEVNILGQWVSEATKVETNTKISGDKFRIPEGIEIMEEGYVYEDEDMEEIDDSFDSLGTELGKELEKSINELKGILGVKKKK